MINLETITQNRLILLLMYLSTTYAFTGNIGIFYNIYVCTRYGMVLLVAIAAMLAIKRVSINRFKISIPIFLAAVSIIVICTFSICVTSNKKGTASQLFWLVSSIMFAWIFYKTESQKLLNVFLDGQIVIVIFQIVVAFLFPTACYARHISKIVFQGSFNHKNALAQQTVFGIIVCICVLHVVREKTAFLIGKIAFAGIGSLTLLMLTDSGTAKSCLLAVILTYFVVRVKRWGVNVPALFLAYTFCFIGSIFSQNPIVVYLLENVLGRDATLTGRLRIWKRVLQIVEMKPLFGYGFNSFWDYNPSLAASALGMGAHNGIFELLLQVGYVGTIFFILTLIWVGRKMRKKIKESNDNALFENLFMAMLLTYAIGERILVPFVYTTIMLLMIILKYADEARRKAK